MRVDNSTFIDRRVAGGGRGAEHDSLLASELHRFLYEYDDADDFRSAWFRRRLELVILEAKRVAASEGIRNLAMEIPSRGKLYAARPSARDAFKLLLNRVAVAVAAIEANEAHGGEPDEERLILACLPTDEAVAILAESE